MSELTRFVNRFRRTSLERELDDEIRFHLEERARRNAAAGMSPRDAVADALDRFGSVDRARAGMRSARMAARPTLAVSVLTLVVLSFLGRSTGATGHGSTTSARALRLPCRS